MLTDNEVIETAVQRLRDNQILAWFQGRTEFGPRALGNRSILASPLNPYSTINLNQFIKHREDFRKFAASVPEEKAAEYFECGQNAWSLATISRVKPEHRQTFEAALLDGDRIRVHVVRRKQDSPMFWQLLQAAGTKTGLPVLYNTSFNLFGEPLVSDPRSAVSAASTSAAADPPAPLTERRAQGFAQPGLSAANEASPRHRAAVAGAGSQPRPAPRPVCRSTNPAPAAQPPAPTPSCVLRPTPAAPGAPGSPPAATARAPLLRRFRAARSPHQTADHSVDAAPRRAAASTLWRRVRNWARCSTR